MRQLEKYIVAASHSEYPYSDAVGSVRDDINKEIIRKELNKVLNAPPTPRDKEIKSMIAEEKEKWEADKIKFESNPLHWSNNKRRRAGLPVLRGKINKNRVTKFHSFKLTPRVFFAIEDILNETLTNLLCNFDFYEQFVDVKDIF